MSDASCPFCAPAADRIFHAGRTVLGLWDAFPVNPGHALLIPKRHVASWFEATPEEQRELLEGIARARDAIEEGHEPDGYNLGVNVGAAAGQTVFHLHVHVIPRYRGDVAQPRGGVRHVIPSRGDYGAGRSGGASVVADADSPQVPAAVAGHAPHDRPLIVGGEDELLPHLTAHLDHAVGADFAVAFVLRSGLELLEPHLVDLLDRGGALRIVTGDYLGVTDPWALRRLLDLKESHPDRVSLRVFEAGRGSFHPKTYIFHEARGGGRALVGSSNLSETALRTGVEWNLRTITGSDASFRDVVGHFNRLLLHPQARDLDEVWIESYAQRRSTLRSMPARAVAPEDEPPPAPPEPHDVQKEALRALEATREAGNSAGLVVLATGLGKTWLSAFDSHRPEYQRILFVAHREEILQQAMDTFRCIRPDAHLGFYTGQEKLPHADVVFASVQTLSRANHLERFATDAFDYVIVDEFHRACARTYRRLLDHFTPKFLLGLTATPERTDGGDLLALCQENLVYRCDLTEGIRRGLLSPFHYYGVPDEVDYANIPWRSSRFDEEALTQAVATRSRAQNALDQFQEKAGTRTLAFCCSTRHADFMRRFFLDAGIQCAAIHSEPTSDPRTRTRKALEAGDIQIAFVVDMFNEGVDLPHVDTVMMLRPTESRILWLQQLGRGLRKAEGKDQLTVIDYIGNHRTFLLKPQTLFELPAGDAAVREALQQAAKREAELPPGCEVTYDLEAIQILESLLRPESTSESIRFFYEDFRERNGVRPSATELYHEGFKPRSLRKAYGSWLGFVDAMGDLPPEASELVRDPPTSGFLDALETTQMTRSFKMLTLQAMLAEGSFPGSMTIEELAEGVRKLAQRSAKLRREFGEDLGDEGALCRLLERNPIDAWVGGKGTGGRSYFTYDDDAFKTTFDVPEDQRESLAALTRELVDWRLAEYLDRSGQNGPGRFVCKVSHSNGGPMLFLPKRDRHPEIPSGWTTIVVEGEALEAKFVKVALNVVRRPGANENLLRGLLRDWFGPHAGEPGTHHRVEFVETDDGLTMRPLQREKEGDLEVGRPYMREEIPPLFGLDFVPTTWQQGFVFRDGKIFLLVTLEKKTLPDQFRYGDRFLSPERFEWESQNRTRQGDKHGQTIRHHAERGIPVHLFVRREAKRGSKAAPFIYCGQVDFEEWEGERPIKVLWKLRQPLPARVALLFQLDTSKPERA